MAAILAESEIRYLATRYWHGVDVGSLEASRRYASLRKNPKWRSARIWYLRSLDNLDELSDLNDQEAGR